MKLTPFAKLFITLIILGVVGYVLYARRDSLTDWANQGPQGAATPGAGKPGTGGPAAPGSGPSVTSKATAARSGDGAASFAAASPGRTTSSGSP